MLPTEGRTFGLLSLLLMAAAVTAALTRASGGVVRALTALLVGLAPAIVVVGVLHDLPRVPLPVLASRAALLLVWLASSGLLGVPVVRSIVGRRALIDVWVRVAGVAASTAYLAGPLIRLLLPDRTAGDRLAWIISEEDNAQIVGVAREVLVDGPRGAELAEQYGTAFANLPLVLMRLAGGPLDSDTDVRLQAITAFTVSTIVAIALIGIALALLTALPHHVHASHRHPSHWPRPIGWLSIAVGGSGAGAAALAALSLLVVLPMRTGFLTFVWGLALVLIGAAFVAVTPTDAPPGARLVVLIGLFGVAVLLLSSWPFISTALLPLLALPLTWIRWRDVATRLRRHRARATVILLAVLLTTLGSVAGFLRWGPAAEVLSYGRDILLIGASLIAADGRITWLALVGLVGSALLILRSLTGRGRTVMLLAVLGAPLGVGLLYVGLRVAARMLTDGQLNYSGVKLFYAIVALAVTLGLASLASQLSFTRPLGAAFAVAVLVLVHTVSPTVRLHEEWADRTELQIVPHAYAVVDAIGSSTNLPIRCLPAPGTPITPVTSLGAYFCARWVEDAFNEGRFSGRRSEFLNARGSNFDDIVASIVAEYPDEYRFAYVMPMGPGWFGWDGTG